VANRGEMIPLHSLLGLDLIFLLGFCQDYDPCIAVLFNTFFFLPLAF